VKRVEFFGPMGSGKSTIYKELINNSQNYIVDAKKEINRFILSSYKNDSFLKYLIFFLLYTTPLQNRVFNNFNLIKYSNNSNNDILDFVYENFSNTNIGTFKYIQRLNWFLKELVNSNIIKDIDTNRYAVVDESLLQKGVAFSFFKNDDYFLEKYLNLIDLPDVAIFVNTPLKVLIDRVENRNVKEHTKEEIIQSFEISLKTFDYLKALGINVIEINGTDNIKNNIDIINKKINNL
jgi:deoxyadenosine/deoxycytidine kinase